MKEILLTQDKVTIVDGEDFEKLNQFKWCAFFNGKNWYGQRGIWINGKQKTILMHREIMNVPKGIQIDHRNWNGLDNRKENLRLCTNQQNQFNVKQSHKNNKLGIKGICWSKRDKRFRATITVNNKTIHLGYFNVLGDADSAYRKAEEKYFGEFARKSGQN